MYITNTGNTMTLVVLAIEEDEQANAGGNTLVMKCVKELPVLLYNWRCNIRYAVLEMIVAIL